jgi:hypothetical protein
MTLYHPENNMSSRLTLKVDMDTEYCLSASGMICYARVEVRRSRPEQPSGQEHLTVTKESVHGYVPGAGSTIT